MTGKRPVLSLARENPDRVLKVLQRLSKLNGQQRERYLDSLADAVPQGRLSQAMYRAK